MQTVGEIPGKFTLLQQNVTKEETITTATPAVGCPGFHRLLTLCFIVWPLLAKILHPDESHPDTSSRARKKVLHPRTSKHTKHRGKRWGFHQIHLAAPGGVSKTGNERGTGHVWWGSILSCKNWAVVQRRTSPPGSLWGNDQLTGKGQHVRPFVASFCYFFVRDLIQPLEAQLQKALADPI